MLLLDGGVTGGGAPDAATRVVRRRARTADALAQFSHLRQRQDAGAADHPGQGNDLDSAHASDGGDTGGRTDPGLVEQDHHRRRRRLRVPRRRIVDDQRLQRDHPESDDRQAEHRRRHIDAIHIERSHQIWIDHCDLFEQPDGTPGPTTVWSTSRTRATSSRSPGRTTTTMATAASSGRSDSSAAAAEDAGKEHVTYDHDLVQQRGDRDRAPASGRSMSSTAYFDHGDQLRRRRHRRRQRADRSELLPTTSRRPDRPTPISAA